MQLLDLANRHRAVRAFEHPFDEAALGIARAIRELWHAKSGLLPRNLSRSSEIV